MLNRMETRRQNADASITLEFTRENKIFMNRTNGGGERFGARVGADPFRRRVERYSIIDQDTAGCPDDATPFVEDKRYRSVLAAINHKRFLRIQSFA